jgi:hypothetical protein
MHEPDFWTNCADAMEMSIEGNRLIVRELAELAGELWCGLKRRIGVLHRAIDEHRHLPPA